MSYVVSTYLIGPNGSGKTNDLTLLSTGDRQNLNLIPSDRHPGSESLGYVPQFFEYPSVSRNVSSALITPLIQKGFNINEATTRVRQSLDSFGFSYLLSRAIHELSGGETRIVQLLAGLMLSYRGIIIDDPFGLLDDIRKCEVKKLIVDYSSGRYSSANYRSDIILAGTDADDSAIRSLFDSGKNVLRIETAVSDERKDEYNRLIDLIKRIGQHADRPSCIDVRDLTCHLNHHRTEVFRNFSTRLESGNLYHLKGPNGAGKSLF